MDELVVLDEIPKADEIYMIAGWQQWADAGAVSSELPRYLIRHTQARRIGHIKSDPFYFFQIPGTQGFLRPEIKMEDGYRQSLTKHSNEIYYSGDDRRGLVIFTGDEPHLFIERYTEAFFNVAVELGVKRVCALGGVYGSIPYDKDRDISCSYSLKHMREELTEYAVRFSNYEGGASLGSYLADWAEQAKIEYFTFYAFVPAYDFTHLAQQLQGLRIEDDYRAWCELMRRINHMFHLGIDLSDLEHQSDALTTSVAAKVDELQKKMPQVNVKAYIESLSANFNETPYMPLDVWERGLGDMFDDKDLL
jgi:predicted ATP-grasp superfamily ATP-dependent carboligase